MHTERKKVYTLNSHGLGFVGGEQENANDDQVNDMRFHLEKFNLNGKLL